MFGAGPSWRACFAVLDCLGLRWLLGLGWAGLGWAGLGWAGLGWAGWVNTLHAMKEYIAIRRKVVASGCPSFKSLDLLFFGCSPKP